MSSGRGVDDMSSGRGADDMSILHGCRWHIIWQGVDDISSAIGADDLSSRQKWFIKEYYIMNKI